jgi:hypothetical protein
MLKPRGSAYRPGLRWRRGYVACSEIPHRGTASISRGVGQNLAEKLPDNIRPAGIVVFVERLGELIDLFLQQVPAKRRLDSVKVTDEPKHQDADSANGLDGIG